MIAKPTTADQAITNAILAVEEAERWAGTNEGRFSSLEGYKLEYRQRQADTYTRISQAWSAIATQLPTMEHVRALNDLIDDGGTVE